MTTKLPSIAGMTLQISVPRQALVAARLFYTDLFNAGPAFEPHDDFLQWQVGSGGGVWIQIIAVDSRGPLPNRVRFAVEDIHEARKALVERGMAVSEISELPGVVRFCSFKDPWGNKLGYYQDLAPQGQQTAYPGTSVNDEQLFRKA